MVLSLITLAATVPLIATSTIQLQETSQRKQDESELELKTEKCHLIGRASGRMSQRRQEQLRDMHVVLRDGYLFLERKPSKSTGPRSHSSEASAHPLAGYLLPYPERSYDGLVSTINSENMLNWVFINKDTYRLAYGVRVDAQPHLTGPMTLVAGEHQSDRVNETEWRIAFDGWEGFVAVQEDDHDEERWAIYFDKDDDGLAGKLAGKGKVAVEIELVRISMGPEKQEGGDEESQNEEPD